MIIPELGYRKSDGLGLMEYLDWAEDLNAVRHQNSLFVLRPGRSDVSTCLGAYPRHLGRPYTSKWGH
jgi:hypothetical protein